MRLNFKLYRKRAGLTQEDAAEALGLSNAQISRIETGKSDTTLQQLQRFAELYGVRPSDLIADHASVDIQFVPVVGEVRAGHWAEALEWPPDERYDVPTRRFSEHYRDLYGLRVEGESMNQAYPPGSIVICCPALRYPHQIKGGEHVHVQRRDQYGLHEATIKELRIDDHGVWWLWPRSTHPEFQAPIRAPHPNIRLGYDDADDVRVVGVVIASTVMRVQ